MLRSLAALAAFLLLSSVSAAVVYQAGDCVVAVRDAELKEEDRVVGEVEMGEALWIEAIDVAGWKVGTSCPSIRR
jgi:hypothetical protein